MRAAATRRTGPLSPQGRGNLATGLGIAVSDVRLQLLGGFELSCGGIVASLPVSTQRVVAFLALHERSLPRPHTAGSLWPEATEARAAGNLRSALWRLGG